MKKNILLIIGLLFLSSCAGKIQINQEFKGSGKGLFIVLSHIKKDKKDEFDNLLMEKIYPAMYSYRDSNDAINTANLKGQKSNRMFKPVNSNEDSTWTFIFMADPFIPKSTARIVQPLIQKYGEDDAKKIMDIWYACFTKKGQESFYGEDIDFIGKENNISTKPGDKVMVVMNYIKSSKNQKFENVVLNKVFPVVREYRDPSDEIHILNQEAIKEMRILRPRMSNKDNTWTYIMMGDPFIENANYLITKPFIQKYGEENVDKVIKEIGWSSNFKRGQISYLFEEVDLTVFQ